MENRQGAHTLTLPQLRAVGRAGWKEGYLFVEETVFRIVALPDPGGVCHVGIRLSNLHDQSPLIRDGWSSMPHAGTKLTSVPPAAR